MISLIIIFQSTLFGIVLLTHKGKKRVSNCLLASFLLLLAIQFGLILLRNVYVIARLYDIMNVFGLLYGPLLYLYSASLIYRNFIFKPKFLLHFVPPAIVLATWFFNLTFRPYTQIIMYLLIVSYIGYSIYSILKYRKVLKNTRTVQPADLKWLQWMLIVFAIILCFDLVEYLIHEIKVVFGITLVHIMVLIMVNWIFYIGLKQPQIFQGVRTRDLQISDETNQNKVRPSIIEEAKEEELYKIIELFETEKPFTNLGVSLSSLAKQLGMSDRRLSQILNHHFQKNFMTFINDYRIDFAKYRLENPLDSKETIMEVMYDVGFNSKSSFNTLFKKNTGLTPSEYKKKFSS